MTDPIGFVAMHHSIGSARGLLLGFRFRCPVARVARSCALIRARRAGPGPRPSVLGPLPPPCPGFRCNACLILSGPQVFVHRPGTNLVYAGLCYADELASVQLPGGRLAPGMSIDVRQL